MFFSLKQKIWYTWIVYYKEYKKSFWRRATSKINFWKIFKQILSQKSIPATKKKHCENQFPRNFIPTRYILTCVKMNMCWTHTNYLNRLPFPNKKIFFQNQALSTFSHYEFFGEGHKYAKKPYYREPAHCWSKKKGSMSLKTDFLHVETFV